MKAYETYEALGQTVKASNPNLTKSDEAVGRWYADRHPSKVSVLRPPEDEMVSNRETLRPAPPLGIASGREETLRPAPSQGQHPLNAGVDFINEMMPNIPSPLDVAGMIPSPLDIGNMLPSPIDAAVSMFGPGSVMDAAGQGVASGISFGGTQRLNQLLGNRDMQQERPYSFGAGQMLGETLGPYLAAGKIMGSAIAEQVSAKYLPKFGRKYLNESPRVRQALNIGTQASAIEGVKAYIQDDPILSSMAIGFISGAGPLGFIHGGHAAWRKAVGWWAKPGVAETDPALMRFLKKWDLPFVASYVAPFSRAADYTLQRLGATSLQKPALQQLRSRLSERMQYMRKALVAKLGPNGALKSQRDVGVGVWDEITGNTDRLKADAVGEYEALAKTSVGKTPIAPNIEFTRVLPASDGATSQEAGSIFSLLKSAIGKPGPLSTGTHKKLVKFLDDLKEIHKPPDTKKVVVHAGSERPSGPSKPPPTFDTPWLGQQPGVPKEVKVTAKSYNWWTKQLRMVGKMLDEPKVRGNPADEALVHRVYGVIQDGIDKQASEINPNFKTAISQARILWQDYLAYKGNATVKALRNLSRDSEGRANYEKVVSTLFNSTDGILDAKRLLGPEAFNSVRQSWLRDLLLGSQLHTKTGEVFMSGQRLITNLKKYSEGIDSDFIQEMFSEKNFFSIHGDPIRINTGAQQKYDLFRELYDNIPKMEPAIAALHGGTEQMQAVMHERIAPGEMLTNPIRFLDHMRGLMSNLLIFRQVGEMYLDQNIKRNPFLGGTLSPMGTGPIGGERLSHLLRGLPRISRLVEPGVPQELMGQLGASGLNQARDRIMGGR
jgi:hypothetical protein